MNKSIVVLIVLVVLLTALLVGAISPEIVEFFDTVAKVTPQAPR